MRAMAMPITYMDDRDVVHGVSLEAGPASVAYPPGATYGPRTLQDFELVWVTSGSARWHWIDGHRELTLRPGALLLARPGMRDELHWNPSVPTRHGYVHFRLDPRPCSASWALVRPALPPGPIAGLLDYLLWLGQERVEGWPTHAAQTISTLLSLFVSAPLPDGRPAAEPSPLAIALDHVRNAWLRNVRPVELAELATAAHVSKEHLGRLFRRHYGAGIVGSLELIRLGRAATLLERSNLTVTEVASSVGFRDPLHFSKRFRRAYGVSPRTYRAGSRKADPLDSRGLRALSRRLADS
jgi:AraC family transcriptional regulator